MSGTKTSNRRGRPKRNNITALQQNEVQESSSTPTSNIDITQPLTIIRCDSPIIRDTTQGVELSRLPKVHYTKRVQATEEEAEEEEEEEEGEEEQNHQEKNLLALHHDLYQPYKRPENHYIHYIEPSDTELYDTVEYDMDEQDRAWLQLYNKERRKEKLGDISPYLFECIIDKLEKEWFCLIKNAPKSISEQIILPEDSACAVCDDTEVENSNAIVFCDGCNVAVHQDCYGIPYIPEGQWLCRKCMISPEYPVSCLFCPNEGGAFKQTNTNQWGHLLCAIWIPEVGVSNTIYMEPIDMINNIPKSRWKLTCFICRKKQGACIQCDNKHCFSAFHVTCAKTAKLCMKMNSHTSQTEGVILKAYCDKHTPKEYIIDKSLYTNSSSTPQPSTTLSLRGGGRGRGRGRGRGASNTITTTTTTSLTREHFNNANNKVARAHQLHYSTGVPITPDAILAKIDNLVCVKNSGIRKRPQLVTAISHYWSLKRESRRGAPLLKRLHLEPWTASSKHNQGEIDLRVRQSVIAQLRTDLEKIRMLSEQIQKRERKKLERTKEQKAYLEMIMFPLEYVIRPILNQFMEIDRNKYFLNHVTAEEAPDYNSIIAKSMCFSEIYQKMASHEYLTLDEFKADVSLIWENSMDYNANDTRYYKVATKLKMASKKLFALAEYKMSRFQLVDGIWSEPIDPSIFEYERETENGGDEDEDEDEDEFESATDLSLHEEEEDNMSVPEIEPYTIEINPSNNPSPSPSVNKVQERSIQSLNVLDNGKTTQTSITNYFAEQRMREQQRIQKREEKRIQELEALEQVKKQPKEDEKVLSLNETKVEEISKEISSLATQGLKPAEKRKQTAVREKRKEPPSTSSSASRLTRSAGLKACIEELTKRPKISHEARTLFSSYNGVSHLDKPVEVFKENRKKYAPVGWVYVDEDENKSSSDEEPREEQEGHRRQPQRKFVRRKRNDIPVPNFKRGEIVWARVTGYPSHPAKFLNLSDEETPPKVLASRRYNGDVLVEFLQVAENHRWGWVERNCICEVGDPEVDRKRLSESLAKKYKTKSFIIEEAKAGYRQAGSILGLDPEPLLASVFAKKDQQKSKSKRSNNRGR